MRVLFYHYIIILITILASCGTPSADPSQNVLLVIIDTLRADRLGCMGYSRDMTPVLDSLAASGAIWTNAHSHSSWTLPSFASILTGLTPREHGAGFADGRMYGLDPSLPTLQRVLRSEGYETAAFFNVVFLNANFGFHAGFGHFDCMGVTGSTGTRRADETVDAFLHWMEGHENDRPFFAVVHLYDPHIPYDPPPPFDTLFADPKIASLLLDNVQLNIMNSVNREGRIIDPSTLRAMIDLYDGEIAFTDREIGRLLAFLRDQGISDNTLVVVTSDHGEEFLEHSGLEHGRTLYQEVIHVPLIMSGEGIDPGSIHTRPCGLVDLMPTVLTFLALEPPAGIAGRDLLMDRNGAPADIPASNLLWSDVPQASLRSGDMKIIWYADGTPQELYDLCEDPSESAPLGIHDPSMTEAVEFYWATPSVASAREVSYDEAERSQLRDLGYIR